MEEKILAKSERYHIGRGLLIFLLIITVLLCGTYVYEYMDRYTDYTSCNDCYDYYNPYERCFSHKYFGSAHDYAWDFCGEDMIFSLAIPWGVLALICGLIYAWMRSYGVVVTDKRVYGNAAFGSRVDLPVDSISAVGLRWPKGVVVSTSSGKIAFLIIKNRLEIFNRVSELLIERQDKLKQSAASAVVQEAPQSNADELKKYKELLDSGVITQEEFDAKKKQLLNL